MSEPTITVNGRTLSEGQAMAVRVAITDFHSCTTDAYMLGRDEHGQKMTRGYHERLGEVLKMMFS